MLMDDVHAESARSPSLFYLLTVGVQVVYFHLITLRHRPQSVGLLWTRDRPVAETSTWQKNTVQETNIHVPGGIGTHDPSKRSAADLRLRPHGHWNRPCWVPWRKFVMALQGHNHNYHIVRFLHVLLLCLQPLLTTAFWCRLYYIRQSNHT
jgi:hypothetical protein